MYKSDYKNESSVINQSNLFRRLAVVSFLAAAISFGTTGCEDESSKSKETEQTCDESLKPAAATSCDCIESEWINCIYPDGIMPVHDERQLA